MTKTQPALYPHGASGRAGCYARRHLIPVSRPVPVLLRALLIVLLLVNTTASAWAASRMAGSLLPAAVTRIDPGSPAHHAMVAAGAGDCHAVAADEPTMPCGADSQHCDCLQHGSALPVLALIALPPGLQLAPAVLPARYSAPPRLAEPVRPPIPALS